MGVSLLFVSFSGKQFSHYFVDPNVAGQQILYPLLMFKNIFVYLPYKRPLVGGVFDLSSRIACPSPLNVRNENGRFTQETSVSFQFLHVQFDNLIHDERLSSVHILHLVFLFSFQSEISNDSLLIRVFKLLFNIIVVLLLAGGISFVVKV